MDDAKAVREVAKAANKLFRESPFKERKQVEFLGILSSYILAEHPVDDGELVTAEWIKKVLPQTGNENFYCSPRGEYKGTVADVTWIEWQSGLCLYIGGYGIGWRVMTRRQLRQLLAGLGITLPQGA